MTVLLTGLLTCLALIVAIGPQSAWLLRQGLRRDRVLLAISCCLAGDVALVFLGTAGVGAVLDHAPWLMEVMRWVGVVCLLWFAHRSFRSARSPQAGLTAGSRVDGGINADVGADVGGSGGIEGGVDGVEGGSTAHPRTATPRPVARAGMSTVTAVAGTGLAVSLLNPHAWVDTLVVLGTMANAFGEEKWIFATGAVLGSLLWFALLGLGGSALARPLNRPRTWQIIDVGVGLTMLIVAGVLTFSGI